MINVISDRSLPHAEVGPVYQTEDPNQFMHFMENLVALGGGDEPEMCLSAIQVNLANSNR